MAVDSLVEAKVEDEMSSLGRFVDVVVIELVVENVGKGDDELTVVLVVEGADFEEAVGGESPSSPPTIEVISTITFPSREAAELDVMEIGELTVVVVAVENDDVEEEAPSAKDVDLVADLLDFDVLLVVGCDKRLVKIGKNLRGIAGPFGLGANNLPPINLRGLLASMSTTSMEQRRRNIARISMLAWGIVCHWNRK